MSSCILIDASLVAEAADKLINSFKERKKKAFADLEEIYSLRDEEVASYVSTKNNSWFRRTWNKFFPNHKLKEFTRDGVSPSGVWYDPYYDWNHTLPRKPGVHKEHWLKAEIDVYFKAIAKAQKLYDLAIVSSRQTCQVLLSSEDLNFLKLKEK